MDPRSILEWLLELGRLIWAYDGVKVIVCHTLINVVVAIAAAFKTGEFNLSRVAEFLYKKLLPYVVIYFVVKAVGEGAGLGALAAVVWVAIEAALTGDLADSLAKLGLQWPQAVEKLVVKRA